MFHYSCPDQQFYKSDENNDYITENCNGVNFSHENIYGYERGRERGREREGGGGGEMNRGCERKKSFDKSKDIYSNDSSLNLYNNASKSDHDNNHKFYRNNNVRNHVTRNHNNFSSQMDNSNGGDNLIYGNNDFYNEKRCSNNNISGDNCQNGRGSDRGSRYRERDMGRDKDRIEFRPRGLSNVDNVTSASTSIITAIINIT